MVGVGMGVLAAFPPESQRMWRVDLSFPVSSDSRAHWEIRLSRLLAEPFQRELRDVARGRAGALPLAIFTWH